MKRKYVISVIALTVVVVGALGYTAFNRFVGNNLEVKSVMASTEGTNATAAVEGTGETVAADKLDGKWDITTGSKVYLSVTTSKETVNFVNEAVKGAWNVNIDNAAAMTGEGAVDMNGLTSENSQRDGHVKDRADLLAVSEFPEATFTTKSFSQIPKEWTEGTAVPVTIAGTLTVKGKTKDVTFDSNAMYKGGQLLLSGKTKVTFSDFGMTSPHNIVLETENELAVQLELVMNKA